jgi:GT2 family glycosyltransferase
MQLSVIIVSYNVKYYLEQCLRSVIKATKYANIQWEAFIVDNASQDNSIAHLQNIFSKEQYPMLHYIANARNVGFSRANNQAIKQAKGDYILFLNPDTIVSEQIFQYLFEFVANQTNIGTIGTRMIADNGKFAKESRRSLPTPWVSFCKMTGLTTLFPRSKTFAKYYMGYLDRNIPHEAEILSGAFMFTSKKALQQCGDFDESFFMYGEDIDLSYRFKQGGFKNYYVPIHILHYKGESTHKNSFRYTHVFYEAMLIFFKKHYGHLSWMFTFPIKCAIIFRALITLISQQINSLFPTTDTTDTFAFIGNLKNFTQAEQLAQKWQFNIRYVGEHLEKIPTNHEALKNATHILTDISCINYGEALTYIANSNHKKSIAFFYPDTQTIITGKDIYI